VYEKLKLDPPWYYTSPGLAFDAALKITDVKLELLGEHDMILMFKCGKGGGISTISNQYAKANHKYMGDAFDSSKPSSFITKSYIDANNLYGCGMSSALPSHGFKWIYEDKLNDSKHLKDQEGVGCILEVDLEYPTKLHDLHNDYLLAPKSMKPGGSDIYKLIPNFNDKKKYVVHYETLKLYESF